MLLAATTITLLTVGVAECLLSSKAARNYLKGKDIMAKAVIEESENILLLEKAALEPLDILIRNALLAADLAEDEQKVKEDNRSTSDSIPDHPVFPVPEWTGSQPCQENLELWGCVGAERDWSVVFVDHMPMPRREVDILRLLPRSQLVVVHDTQDLQANFPDDFYSSLSLWAGRPCLTQLAIPAVARVSGPAVVYTTIIQGDMDTEGRIFRRAEQILGSAKREIELIYSSVNPDNMSYGTHIKLLVGALLATAGDILELGTGTYSTDLIHSIAEQQNTLAMSDNIPYRTILSADASITWLAKSKHLHTNFHQFLLVPAYSNGLGCKTNFGVVVLSNITVPSDEDVTQWAGRREGNKNWEEISCQDLKL